jgi:hypothetical protein
VLSSALGRKESIDYFSCSGGQVRIQQKLHRDTLR